jgi:hypothetical protein
MLLATHVVVALLHRDISRTMRATPLSHGRRTGPTTRIRPNGLLLPDLGTPMQWAESRLSCKRRIRVY